MALEPLKWKGFSGLNNRQRPEELKAGELSVARNVDINDAGRLGRRGGFDDIATLTGNYHSMWSPDDESICLAVKEGNLFRVNTDWTESLIRASVGGGEMAYEYVKGTVIYSNGSIISTIVNGVDTPFVVPTQNFKAITPAGTILVYYKGRLYVANKKTLWITDALALNRVDLRTGFKQFPTDIVMVAAVDGGLYVSDSEITYFLSGPSPEKMVPVPVAKAAIKGSARTLRGTKFNAEIQGKVAFFTTAEGIYMGLSDGSVIPITLKIYKMPSSVKRAAAMVRDEAGKLQLVTRLYN